MSPEEQPFPQFDQVEYARTFPRIIASGKPIGRPLLESIAKCVDIGSSYFLDRFLRYDLRGINLEGANLAGQDFYIPHYYYAAQAGGIIYLNHANLKFTNLSGTKLINTICKGADFTGAILDQNTRFGDYPATRSGASFVGAKFHNIDFRTVGNRLRELGNNFSGASFRHSNLSSMNLSEVDFKDCDFAYADLSNSCFKGSEYLCSYRLRGATFRNADLSYTDFRRTNIQGADFRGANLKGALFDSEYLNKRVQAGDYDIFVPFVNDPTKRTWCGFGGGCECIKSR